LGHWRRFDGLAGLAIFTTGAGLMVWQGKPVDERPHHGKATNPGRASPSGASHPTAKAKRTA